MANKKVVSVLSTAAIGTLIATAVGSTVFAAVDGLVVKNAAGAYFNYDLDALKASVVNDALGQAGAELYKDFDAARTAGSIVSYHDNKVGFVDSAAVQKAALDAALAGTNFALDTFTESSKETVLPATVYQATVTDGKVVAGAEVKPTTGVTSSVAVQSVSAVNTTSTDDIASKVESGATIKVTFNAALDSTTVNSTNFALKTGTTTVATDVTLSTDKKTVSIKPVSPMTIAAEYNLTIAAAVKADGADATLGTAVAKTFTVANSLSLASIKVGGTALDTYVTTAGALVLTLNKDISATSVNTDTIKIYNETDKTYVALTAASIVATTSKTITVTPTADYIANKNYTLKIDGLKALDGTTINGYNKTYGYSTKVNVAPTITAAPTGHTGLFNNTTSKMLSYTVGGGAVPAAMTLASPIKAQVQFGRAMDAATLTSDTFYIAEADTLGNEVAGTKVAGTVTYDAASYTATFMPTSALKEKQKYVAVITTSVKDSVEVPSVAQAVGFTTDDYTAPTVKSTSVDTGARVDYNEDVVIHFSEKMDGAQMALVAAGAGQQAFTAATSVRVYDQTTNATIDGVTNAGLTLDKTYVADATDPRLIIKAPTAGWGLNKVYQIVLNGHTVGEATLALSDALVAGTKTHGNMLEGDTTLTFTTVAESLPTVTAIKAMKTTDGPAATTPTTELSRTDMTYNVQNAGTLGANNIFNITFSKNMSLANLTNADFELWLDNGAGGATANDGVFAATEKVAIPAAEFALSTDKKTLTWTPAASLAALKATESEGRLVVKYTTTDESGQDIGTTASADIAYKFTTGSGPAYAAATDVTGGIVPPVKYATGVKKNQVIETKFSEAIKYTTLNNVEIRKGSVDGDVVAGTWYSNVAATTLPTANLATAYFKPAADLAANTKYYVVVPSTVTDARGNVATAYNYYFTTENTIAPIATITMPTTPTGGIRVAYDMVMATATAGVDFDETAAYTVTVNGVAAAFTIKADTDKKGATLYLDAIPADKAVVNVAVNSGVTGSNGKVTASAVTAEQLVSNTDAIAAYGIKEAKYDATNRVLTITLDRAGAFAAAADGSEINITNGAYNSATNFASASVSTDGLTLTYVFKDTNPSTLSIASNVTKVNIVAGKVTYNNSVPAATNFGTTAVTIK